jgi:hypothetical protein
MFDEISNWRMTYYDNTNGKRRAWAARIYHVFVEPGAVFEGWFFFGILICEMRFLDDIFLKFTSNIVNLSSTLREQLKSKIISEPKETQLPNNLFVEAQTELMLMMLGAFLRFERRGNRISKKLTVPSSF